LRKCFGGLSTNCNYYMGGGESFADDLNFAEAGHREKFGGLNHGSKSRRNDP